MAQLAPPSSEERDLYYFGLPSRPKLVARSSSVTDPWVNPQMPGPTTFTGTMNMYPKSFLPAKDNALLRQLWNDATSSLRIQIIEAVNVVDWTAIDILRVGLNEQFHNVLLIAVMRGSTSWRQGHSLALRCKAILEEHGINNMHCEIRESIVTFLTDAPTLTPPGAPTTALNDFQLSSELITDPHVAIKAELSDNLGTKIAMKDSDFICGTKGLYLALSPSPSSAGAEPKVVALTCRHVVLNSKTEGLQEYRHQQSQPFKEVIQVDQPTYERMLARLASSATRYQDTATTSSVCGETQVAAEYKELSDQTTALKQAMDRYRTPSSRVFGHLLYSPEFGCTSGNSKTWLRDWALIELLPSRHQAQLSSLRNKVFVGPRTSFNNLIADSERAWSGLPHPGEPPVNNCTLKLQRHVVPMTELSQPPHFADYSDERAILVGKYGAAGGLTLGLGNKLKSVVRHAGIGDGESMSEEWCITSANLPNKREAAFSMKGDSGSCVWDMNRRIAGMVTAGGHDENNILIDVTYAQPMERLLADIRSQGFYVSLL